MASVLGWLPQPAGPVRVQAGWPGSNGSTMAAKSGAAAAAEAEGVPDGAAVVAGAVPLLGDVALLQPAARPISAAATTARARYRLCIRSS
ncbi:MAG TPA: hypothetical protein VK280_24395 [Streptosporangiaceae bacterium]|nr:hypothetical protein [Streptosporangiaceae bacterium]